MQLLTSWQIEVHAAPDVLRACFGTIDEGWMKALPGRSYRSRLRWEFVDLPRRLRADPHALVWAPFGPPLNLAIASRTVWMSRNLLPLLPAGELELSPADHLRVRVLRVLFSRWARRARKTISVSSHARDRLASLAGIAPASIAVIPHGVDRAAIALRCSSVRLEELRSTRYLLHVGQPVAYRRTRELFEAFALLAQRRPDTPQLVVAGQARPADRAYEQACLRLLAPLEAAGRVQFLGQTSHSDTLALMAHAHAFAYPSVHEDCPNVVLEALSARRVGVYADIPAVRELADDAGLFVRDPRPVPLADALERAIFDADERARVTQRAAQRASMFTWDRTAERTAAVLEDAAK
jgi:alpha-1,3-rhamnosyl/mannosyltransferase